MATNNRSSVVTTKCRNQSSTARLRWKMLSKALNESSDVDQRPPDFSVRRFESFGCIKLTNVLTTDENELITDESNELLEGKWFECRFWDNCLNKFGDPFAEIKILNAKIPIHELLNSLDNTGNVCLWPSEEVLAYYIFKNQSLFANRTVLELGAGMTGLSGLVTAVFTSAKEVIVTDGNQRCVENVKSIIHRNRHRFRSVVSTRLLIWSEESHMDDICGKVDVIICSDCLYFDTSRHLLVQTIHKLLNSTGIAIVLAPKRGTSFGKFIELCDNLFELSIIDNYDQHISELHHKFVVSADYNFYDTDLHYPVMIELKTSKQIV